MTVVLRDLLMALNSRLKALTALRREPIGLESTSHFQCECGASHPEMHIAEGEYPEVFFAFRDGTRDVGSVRMRGFQAAESLSRVGYAGRIEVLTLERLTTRKPRGAVVIVLKTAIKERFSAELSDLQRWNTLLFDVIDGRPASSLEEIADGFLCSSASEYQERSMRGQASRLVYHAVDSTISWPRRKKGKFGVVYYGLPENALHLDKIPAIRSIDYIEEQHIRGGFGLKKKISRLGKFSHHYIVRNWNIADGHKPLTKGFLAAWCGALVIGSREDPETLLLLGEEYPYLSDTSQLHHVEQTLEIARGTYNSAKALAGERAMRKLKQLSCPFSSALSLRSAIEEFAN